VFSKVFLLHLIIMLPLWQRNGTLVSIHCHNCAIVSSQACHYFVTRQWLRSLFV